MRTRQADIVAVRTATLCYELEPQQAFYQTPKAYEIWQETPELRRLARIDRKRVFFVYTKLETEAQ